MVSLFFLKPFTFTVTHLLVHRHAFFPVFLMFFRLPIFSDVDSVLFLPFFYYI